MDTAKRRRASGNEPETMTKLPEELILEILTWVPGRELGKCKCVCKQWKSLIGSPPFLPLYRRRNRCLMVYWSDGVRLHFFYSPLRRHRTEPHENFERLGALPVGRRTYPVPSRIDTVTQLVNGVICTGEVVEGRRELQLKVISVCTGQALRIPPPLPHGGDTSSSYHLGYDPISGRYKLLRSIFRQGDKHRMKVDVITLGPTGTVWEWRELDEGVAGIRQLFTKGGSRSLYNSVTDNGVLMFPGDGFLCWIREGRGMILFDLNKEVFRWVKFPKDMEVIDTRMMVPRVLINKEDRLTIYLYVFPSSPDIDCEFFVLEDEKANVWEKRILELKGGLVQEQSYLGAANGSPISSSQPSIMLMSSRSRWESRRDVYWTNGKGMWRFWVGQLPYNMESFDRGKLTKEDATRGFTGRLSCLLDSNVLYLPLKDVLDGNGLV